MKLFSDNPLASMSLANDESFKKALRDFLAPAQVEVVIETGTFLGLGSTRFLADFFQSTKPPRRFVTMEVNWDHYRQARANLKPYAFVDCRWGASVDRREALDFISTDDAIRNHRAFPDIWIDDVDDPVAFYSAEMKGSLNFGRSGAQARTLLRRLANHVRRNDFSFLWDGESLLTRFLNLHREHRPLILLDSAGGVGYLEFQITRKIMDPYEYFLILDDVHHLKHFRSLRDVQADTRFVVLAQSAAHGWVLAHYRPK
jgi:hypothetical protein